MVRGAYRTRVQDRRMVRAYRTRVQDRRMVRRPTGQEFRTGEWLGGL